MDKVLRAVLRAELAFFIRKVFATISPGETYLCVCDALPNLKLMFGESVPFEILDCFFEGHRVHGAQTRLQRLHAINKAIWENPV